MSINSGCNGGVLPLGYWFEWPNGRTPPLQPLFIDMFI